MSKTGHHIFNRMFGQNSNILSINLTKISVQLYIYICKSGTQFHFLFFVRKLSVKKRSERSCFMSIKTWFVSILFSPFISRNKVPGTLFVEIIENKNQKEMVEPNYRRRSKKKWMNGTFWITDRTKKKLRNIKTTFKVKL